MKVEEKTIAKIFDKSVEALGIMTKSLCDAIKSTKNEKRYVMYRDQKCELLGTTDGGGTLNTGGLAFCIIMPDGSVKNVQDTDCRFLKRELPEKAGCNFCRDEQGYTIGNMYVCDKCGRQVP